MIFLALGSILWENYMERFLLKIKNEIILILFIFTPSAILIELYQEINFGILLFSTGAHMCVYLPVNSNKSIRIVLWINFPTSEFFWPFFTINNIPLIFTELVVTVWHCTIFISENPFIEKLAFIKSIQEANFWPLTNPSFHLPIWSWRLGTFQLELQGVYFLRIIFTLFFELKKYAF